MRKKGILMVVSGFSGSGKGTLMKALMKTYDQYALSISMTTRKPREGELDAVDYFFLSKEEFEKQIANNGLIEYASYCDNYYGTPKAYVQDQLERGKDVILEIEIQGALKVKEKFPETLLLFVTPPSAEILKERLVGRGTETPDVINKRLSRAVEEAEYIDAYDYLIVNDNLECCVEKIHHTVNVARSVPIRKKQLIKNMKDELLRLSEGEV